MADNIRDVEEFGDLPKSLLNRLSQLLSKRRVITSRTLDLFLRPDYDTIDVYDCGSKFCTHAESSWLLTATELEVDDYIKMFAVVPKAQNVNLRNAGQFKDEIIDYIVERHVPLKNLQLEAANLLSNQAWAKLFSNCGQRLEYLKLTWLDYSMDDDTFDHLVSGCPNLKRLKIKKCFRLSDQALSAISNLHNLEHLSLRFPTPITSPPLGDLIASIGANLRTLSLESFEEADDEVLSTIHHTCTQLTKFRFCENDLCTDAGFVSLFHNWPNPPLSFIDLSSNRSIDYAQPDGPEEEPTGLASAGFESLMAHSGSRLEHLEIASCRHIDYAAYARVFDGKKEYPLLRDINISFLTKIDTTIAAGIFRSCPAIKKVTAFGCFNISDVAVPKGVALIGVPNAQDSIVQEGDVEMDWMA